jgi:predicted porin
MNKSLAFAACYLLSSSAVYAQSSVTVYGIVDAGFNSDKGRFAAGTRNSLDSGNQSPSRFGFTGSETLGTGLAAIYTLESGFNIDDGALSLGADRLFGRKAFVGLRGKFGTVKAGRQDSPLFNATYIYDPFGVAIAGGYTRIFTNNSAFRRNDNTINYATPALNGFNGEAAYSFGEAAGDSSVGRSYSASAGYAAGPLSVSLSFQSVNSTPVRPAAIATTRLTALGASYDFKVVKLAALFQTNKANTAMPLDTSDVLIGATVPFGASTFLASYLHHSDNLRGNAGARQFAVGYTYAVSKRTNLYTGLSRLSNEQGARFGLAAVAAGGSASGTTARLFTVGARHLF